jgi:uncharacterized protein YjbI with pentapeptide repeats
LRYANLSYADLRGTDLSDADLRDANLTHADLRGALREHDPPIGWEIVHGRLERAI